MAYVLLVFFALFVAIHSQIDPNEELTVLLEKLLQQTLLKKNTNQKATKTANEESNTIYLKSSIEGVGRKANVIEQHSPDIKSDRLYPNDTQRYNDDSKTILNKTTYQTEDKIDHNNEQNTPLHKNNINPTILKDFKIEYEYEEEEVSDDDVFLHENSEIDATKISKPRSNSKVLNNDGHIVVTKITKPRSNSESLSDAEKRSKDNDDILDSNSDIVVTKITKPFSNSRRLTQLPFSENFDNDDDLNNYPKDIDYDDYDDEDDNIRFRMFESKKLRPTSTNPKHFGNNNCYSHACPKPIPCHRAVNTLPSKFIPISKSAYPTTITYPSLYQTLLRHYPNYVLPRAMKYHQYFNGQRHHY